MEVKVTLDLEELKKRLCPDCQKAMDNYLKELAIKALSQEVQNDDPPGAGIK